MTVLAPPLNKSNIRMEDYWELLQIDECHAYGIRGVPEELLRGCDDYWNQAQRYWLTWALALAEKRLALDRWLGFPIRRTYEPPRQLRYALPAYAGKYLRGIGLETETVVQAGQAIELSTLGTINDPVTFTVAVTFSDPNELLIYYPGTRKFTIYPSEVTISGGTATVTIPRCRLLKPEYFRDYSDVNDRPLYTDDSYFLSTVDVVRNYLNPLSGTNVVWYRHSGRIHCACPSDITICDPSGPCSDVKQLACGYIIRERDGFFNVEPATYANGSWSKASYAIARKPDGIEFSAMRFYYDRYDPIDPHLMRAIAAVVHNNMPEHMCSGCDMQSQFFKEDRNRLEPPVNLGLGPSTWGIFEAVNIIREFDSRYHSHMGGML